MSMLDQIHGRRAKVSTVVDTAILYLITRGTMENFTKFGTLSDSMKTRIILNDTVGTAPANQ